MNKKKTSKLIISLLTAFIIFANIGFEISQSTNSEFEITPHAYADDDRDDDRGYDRDKEENSIRRTTTNQTTSIADTEAPTIFVFNPAEKNFSFVSNEDKFNLKGMVIDNEDTSPDVLIEVNGNKYNEFGDIKLKEGENKVSIIATDSSGNEESKVIYITRSLEENIESQIQLLSDEEFTTPSPISGEIELGKPLDYYSNKLVEMNLADDKSDLILHRFKDATRIEVLDLILKSLNITPEPNGDVYFTDVDESNPNYNVINTAINRNIINGFKDNTFRPNATIKRSELLKILFNANGYNLSDKSPQNKNFSDEDVLHWSAPYLEAAKLNNILNGYADGTVKSNNNITRGELAKIILLTKKQSKEPQGLAIPEMMPDANRKTLIEQRSALENLDKNVPTPTQTPPTSSAQANNIDIVRQQEIEKQRQLELERQAQIAAQQKAEQERIARAAAETEKLRLEQIRLAQQEAARIAAQQAAASARSKRSRRSRRS